MYRYETHLHTAPVSKCASASVRDSLEFYKSRGYDGVFITNHFLDGNVNCDKTLPYAEQLDFYFSDYEAALALSEEIGIKVFLGVEMSYMGTDFLIYGLPKEGFYAHPEIMGMKRSEELQLLIDAGALVIQAHPFREARYLECIRLFPRQVHGVEILNAARSDFENKMAALYAESYGLLPFAGSDNHRAGERPQAHLAGMQGDAPIADELDFACRVKNKEMTVFYE